MAKVYLASDHAGYALKRALIPYIGTLGFEAEDLGDATPAPEDDYPDFVGLAARAVASDATARAIIIGKSGEGEAMCANRVRGVRASVYYGGLLDVVRLAREHNDANVLALGAAFVTEGEAKRAVELFLATPFSNDPRHVRRLAKF